MHTLSKPAIKKIANILVEKVAEQFVIGKNIDITIKKAIPKCLQGYTYSFDMLGEAALTKQDAKTYLDAYIDAIEKIGNKEYINLQPNISIKLSALHPRYEYAQADTILEELGNILINLCIKAKQFNVSLTIDAEESNRLELSLALLERLFIEEKLKNWNGLGLAVQAYQKRSLDTILWLEKIAIKHKKVINVRLVKGAYWDTEIKIAQELGLSDYPVFTRKSSTDLSYIVCAKKLLNNPEIFYPQFATHNAHTVATILEIAQHKKFEFQCLFGMGQDLYKKIIADHKINVRIYAPVGSYQDLLPYLVRRLLENGANSSFVNAITNPNIKISTLIQCPIKKTKELKIMQNEKIHSPQNILNNRKNSYGFDLTCNKDINNILKNIKIKNWQSFPIINGKEIKNKKESQIISPIDKSVIGFSYSTTSKNLLSALETANNAQKKWEQIPVKKRANILEQITIKFEENYQELINICVHEAGKTIPDAIAEVREAVDFCRYYAQQAVHNMQDISLQGPTGESNILRLQSRGVFLCISPWNFPLAIFTGQILAAIVTGNTVLAKPAGQTTLIATYAIKLMLNSGIPNNVLHLIPASGKIVGETLLSDHRIKGICFTGSNETAQHINKVIANRGGELIPFIAETGGQNVMLVDSTALPEQVVHDVIASAFQSAGQRCSALRILILQEEIADKVIKMLSGAMQELNIGDPRNISTDIGPVIDTNAKQTLMDHINFLNTNAKPIYICKLNNNYNGHYVPPCAYEINNLSLLTKENFGPILHIKRFKESHLNETIEEINKLGFGLTFGIHTRIEERVQDISNKIKVGNIYANRNMIGAMVGVQPFGGRGLSGTGPKAGGPHYLKSFTTEQTITINTTAQGGNTTLMNIGN